MKLIGSIIAFIIGAIALLCLIFCVCVFFAGVYIFVFESIPVGSQYIVGSIVGGFVVQVVAAMFLGLTALIFDEAL